MALTNNRSEAARRGWAKRKARIAARLKGADPEGWLRRPAQPSVSGSEMIYLFGQYWKPEHLALLFAPTPDEVLCYAAERAAAKPQS